MNQLSARRFGDQFVFLAVTNDELFFYVYSFGSYWTAKDTSFPSKSAEKLIAAFDKVESVEIKQLEGERLQIRWDKTDEIDEYSATLTKTSTDNFLHRLTDSITAQVATIKELVSANEQLKSAEEAVIHKYSDAVLKYTEREHILFSKFAALLNAKTAKIVELMSNREKNQEETLSDVTVFSDDEEVPVPSTSKHVTKQLMEKLSQKTPPPKIGCKRPLPLAPPSNEMDLDDIL
ncbi:unnamed protein product [Mesocestoides corti]|uniref:DNA repair protein XRCC4 n=1 Tax=Mesocestoides corti TaxID=53468 RepID=A0A0R3UMZ2_MESCO|nr:unnamed protein product [Mesocestoides corti]